MSQKAEATAQQELECDALRNGESVTEVSHRGLNAENGGPEYARQRLVMGRFEGWETSQSVTRAGRLGSRRYSRLAACATRELDFGGPGAVGRVGIEEAGKWLGEVGEFVTSGLTATDAYGAGAHAQREETPSEAGFGEEILAVLC